MTIRFRWPRKILGALSLITVAEVGYMSPAPADAQTVRITYQYGLGFSR